jgi:hypothetical protein
MKQVKYRCQFYTHDTEIPERVEVVFLADVDELKIVEPNFIGNDAQWFRAAIIKKARTFLPPGKWVELAGGVFKIIEAHEHGAHPPRRADRSTGRDEGQEAKSGRADGGEVSNVTAA